MFDPHELRRLERLDADLPDAITRFARSDPLSADTT